MMGMILIVWGGLIAVAIWLLGYLFPSTSTTTVQHNDKNSSLSTQEILKIRYVQGEITYEQYQKMLQTVQQ